MYFFFQNRFYKSCTITVIAFASYGTMYRVSSAIIGLYAIHMGFSVGHDIVR